MLGELGTPTCAGIENPQDLLPERPNALRAGEAPANAAATQRPEDKQEQD